MRMVPQGKLTVVVGVVFGVALVAVTARAGDGKRLDLSILKTLDTSKPPPASGEPWPVAPEAEPEAGQDVVIIPAAAP